MTRAHFDSLIADKVAESITAAREAIEKAGLSPHDIERIVFVGGPSQYKPLREKVAFELGISPSMDVNPMTAVAEGAAVFAESDRLANRKTAPARAVQGIGLVWRRRSDWRSITLLAPRRERRRLPSRLRTGASQVTVFKSTVWIVVGRQAKSISASPQ